MPLTISTPPVVHDTFVIERTYPSAPQRVFAAFADSAKKRRWFAEGKGHELQHYAMDFRVNGKEEARFRFDESTPISGMICVTDGTYLDIVQDGGGYKVTISNLDGPVTYPAAPAAGGLTFERTGVRETLHPTDGAGTGMKWLADKTRCLTVKPGEGFCRG